MIPLTKSQKELMAEFYSIPATTVIFSKSDRNSIWGAVKHGNKILKEYDLDLCPALRCEIEKSQNNDANVQSAVFSECVFAQTLANMLKLNKFYEYNKKTEIIPNDILALIKSYFLTPRYIYANKSGDRMLIQAGGCGGVDSALIHVIDKNVFTIEFKEAGAKTSEPDLPKYGEDGKIIITDEFQKNYPQFIQMLTEKVGFDVFKNMGHNDGNFSDESILRAVSDNYQSKKFADVICTEDKNGYLVIIPSNQASVWAGLEGELRTAGRNPYEVWTPNALKKFISDVGGKISKNTVSIDKDKLAARKPRGGMGITGYKINPLFFVRCKNCTIIKNTISFDLEDVLQLNPTITAKVFFRGLDHKEVKDYYKQEF